MLSEIRVLEISDPSTMLAGQILGDLGADVITVEPPEGAHGRRYEPFIEDIPGIDRSLTWHALNRNKRAMTLRADRVDGRALLTQLAQRSDIVLEAIGVNRPALLQKASFRPQPSIARFRPFQGMVQRRPTTRQT